MGKKLFSLESVLDKDEETLLDRVLKTSLVNKSSISLTADLIAQRSNLKKEITDKMGDVDTKKSKSTEDTPVDTIKQPIEPDINKTDSDTAQKDKTAPKVLDPDQEQLKTSNDKPDTDIKKPATESYSCNTLSRIFSPVKNRYNDYLVALESYNVPDKLALEEQPIAYVKDAVKESLTNLINITNNYISNNETFIEKISKSIKELNLRLTPYVYVIETEKYHFTRKFVTSKDILAAVSVPEQSKLISTSRVLLDYTNNSTKNINLLLQNSFDNVTDAYSVSHFELVNGDYVYKKVLPGFNSIRVHIDEYTNYLRTNIQDYQYYVLKTLKTGDLYILDAIELNDDADLKSIVRHTDTLFVNLGLYVDNIQTVNTSLKDFIDQVKVIMYNLDNNGVKDLTSLCIDDKIKDFIKLKLVIETCYINTNIIIDYVTGVLNVLDICVDFKS